MLIILFRSEMLTDGTAALLNVLETQQFDYY